MRRPVNLGVALDRSGSMAGEPLEIAKAALGQFVGQLLPEDRLTVVAFDDTAVPIISAKKATTKRRCDRQLGAIEVGGMTNLSAGWLAASDLVSREAEPETYSRVVLLSDGLANAGVVVHDKLADIAIGLRKRGIATTTIGIGSGYDDDIMSLISGQSGGNAHHLDTLDGVGQILGTNLKSSFRSSLRTSCSRSRGCERVRSGGAQRVSDHETQGWVLDCVRRHRRGR